MNFVRSDSALIAETLLAMKGLVLAYGGDVHPATAIEENNGSIRVICDAPDAQGLPLFRVPDALLVPTDQLCWSGDEETLQLASPARHLSAERAEMLELFITLYNATGKLGWLSNQAARILLHDTEFAAQLMLVRPGQLNNASTPAAALIQTRTYLCRAQLPDIGNASCLMPLIDFMNNHVAGSEYQHGPGHLLVNVSRPLGSKECYANYGSYRDPLGLALGHGYLDPHSPFTQSAPAIIDLAGFGRLEILGKRIATKHRADPPEIEFSDDGVTLSHLSGDIRAPHYLQATLRLPVMASGKRRGIADAAVDRALANLPHAIMAANKQKLGAFRSYLATRPELPLASLLSEAALCQLANLEKILAA